ncbi:hypothetical protein [Streptomyces cathayae]|uniref:Uncharacterized protein n=1 Tax=Streptomyces cathayae TaxID=3031124 RepID=A0ABY8K267_9ACTN|nr:hypothetical protein [Streptomyces sp. HUAS 5]WGD42345.1 hypothetical protein PYS65_20590 [Streptomyces sp. HUAS 5]
MADADDSDGVASRLTVNRGSRFSVEPSASLLASGTGPALPGVGSADDSRCFDLSGDSPATDASSVRRASARTPTEP